MPPSSPVRVAAAIIEDRGKILITQRRREDHLGGLWEFPGGKREASESLEACLRREIREELGLEIEIQKFWKTVKFSYPEKNVELHFYFCRIRSGEVQPLGCQAYRWVEVRELADFPFPPADREILSELASAT